jgi:hypothetical protein
VSPDDEEILAEALRLDIESERVDPSTAETLHDMALDRIGELFKRFQADKEAGMLPPEDDDDFPF